MGIVWKLGDKPTGLHKSFQKRSWPMATLGRDGRTVAQLVPKEDYVSYYPSLAESTTLIIRVMDWRGEKPQWKRLTKEVIGVKEGKRVFQAFWDANPEWREAVD